MRRHYKAISGLLMHLSGDYPEVWAYQEAIFLHCKVAELLEDHMHQLHELVIVPA